MISRLNASAPNSNIRSWIAQDPLKYISTLDIKRIRGFEPDSYDPKRDSILTDSALRGHLVESTVGAYLVRRAVADHFKAF